MANLYTCVTLCLYLYLSTVAANLPPDIKLCKLKDPECVARSTQDVIRNRAKIGIREVNVIPFDPLHIPSLKLQKNPSSPVNVELNFKDIDILGLQETKVLKMQGFETNIDGITEIHAVVPKLILKGPYTVDGQVLVLPITGKGNSEIIGENADIRIKLKTKGVEKGGRIHLEVENLKLEIKPQHVSFRLDGLFNGNQELGENMNKFLNENWQDIFNELHPALAEGIGLIMKHILNSFTANLAYEDWFQK